MKYYAELLHGFHVYIQGIGYKKTTVRCISYSVHLFIDFISSRGVKHMGDVGREEIQAFIHYLKEKKVGRIKKPYSAGTINRRITGVRHFFKYLYRHELILTNPMAEESYHIKAVKSSKGILTGEEINRLLDGIQPGDRDGLRDRAFFELLYSSGLRVSEAVHLNVSDLDLKARILQVREGKGGKDRYVPFSEVAAIFIKKYITQERPRQLIRVKEKDALFITEYGRISDVTIRQKFKKLIQKQGITRKRLTVHSIRHTTATHLLEAGADVRYVQELLGHENIGTTVQYTHLLHEHLKRAYKSAHPRENQYYEEIDAEYLRRLDALTQEIARRKVITARYPYTLYLKK